MPEEPYVKLVIGLQSSDHKKYLIALRTTADYYGWTKHLEVWRPKTVETAGGMTLVRDPGRKGNLQFAGGRRHRISRSKSTMGNPAGLTNAFRTSARCGVCDLAELAHFTEGEWEWMEGLHGERIRRDRWEALYQGSISSVKGGLVSV